MKIFRPVSLLLMMIVLCISLPVWSERQEPSFIIFTSGFWGTMDRLPSRDPAWLAASPYPHFRKHQDADFLRSSSYQPIPQKYLATAEGPSITKMFLCSYYLLEHEMAYWAKRVNTQSGDNRVKIFDDWQSMAGEIEKGRSDVAGDVNIIYLKYDWRLEMPRVDRDYVAPLLDFIDQHWPRARIHWVGHSLGGTLGRYVVSAHPNRFESLISVGGSQFGMYEIALESRGERTLFGGNPDLEKMQEISFRAAEKFFFGTSNLGGSLPFPEAAREFMEEHVPMIPWMDPLSGKLTDGFGNMPLLKDSTAHAIAIYGLGYGSYGLDGVYHPELPTQRGIGPAVEPNDGSPLEYALSGDGRVDPVSARGPFSNTLCLGKEQSHGNLMWSPLVLTMLIDRYLFNGTMPEKETWLEMRRLEVPWESKKLYLHWIDRSRAVWDRGH